jgi:hypothetical protein
MMISFGCFRLMVEFSGHKSGGQVEVGLFDFWGKGAEGFPAVLTESIYFMFR